MRGRQPDEIDAAIDSFFSRLGRNWKAILVWVILIGFVYYIIAHWKTYGGIVSTVAGLVFQLLFAAMFLIIQFGALFWFLGRGRVYWIEPGESGIYFKDYKGNREVLEVATRVVTLVRGVRAFKEMGGEVSRGLLLVGPPGTGKSYLAQAISAEAGVPYCYASAPSFQNMFMGIGNMRVMMLYSKARKKALKYGACILFIDEIDALGASRGGGGGGMMGGFMGMGGGSGMLNELLMQMDPPNIETGAIKKFLRKVGLRRGKVVNPPVLTIGATNLPDVLDPALLRPGRFDRQIRIDKPDLDGRREVIEYYLAKVKHVSDMPLEKMANDTIDYTPVAIKYVINEAMVNAHFNGKDVIDYKDFTRAREYHEWGLRQPIKSMKVEEKRRIAYHETGHAFAQIKLEPSERLSKVTIIRHGSALGLSAAKPLEEQYLRTKEQLLADMQISLASKAAERLFLGTETTGMGGDLPAATRIAAYYLGMCGMGGTLYAPMAFGQFVPDGELKHQIEVLLDEQYKKVKILLEANRETVTAIAEALLIREELDGDEVFEIVREVEEHVARRAAEEREAVPALVGAAASSTGDGNGHGNGHGETAIGPEAHSREGNGHGGNGYSGNGHPEGNGNPGQGNGSGQDDGGWYPGATLG